jgi:hypothetical protein
VNPALDVSGMLAWQHTPWLKRTGIAALKRLEAGLVACRDPDLGRTATPFRDGVDADPVPN